MYDIWAWTNISPILSAAMSWLIFDIEDPIIIQVIGHPERFEWGLGVGTPAVQVFCVNARQRPASGAVHW
jgi:hypothetical protein